MKRKSAFLFCAAVSVAISKVASASLIGAGDLLVYRVGIGGGGSLTSAATSVFINDYSATGNLVQSFALPDGVNVLPGAGQNDLTASGSASSEGALSVSPDGQYVAFTGYGASNGTTGVVGSSAARVVGILSTTDGSFDTSTGLTNAFLANNVRGAVYDGTHIYASGTNNASAQNYSGGVQITTLGATTSSPITNTGTTTNSSGGTSTTNNNFRAINIIAGQLYASSGSSVNYGINLLGSSPTTTATPVTNLGVDYNTSSGAYAFAFATLPGGPAQNELYVADSRGYVLKYSLISGSYVSTGQFNIASGVTGLTAAMVNGNEVLYATTPSSIYTFTDTTGYDGTVSGNASVIATAPAGQAFRGIALVPEPASAGIILCSGTALLLGRKRRVIDDSSSTS